MDLTLSRPAQARLDFVEGLKSFVSTEVMAGVKADFAAWADERDAAALRDRQILAARLEPDPRYQASRGLQRLSQEAMWAEVARGLEPRRAALETEMRGDDQADDGPAFDDKL